MMWQISKTFVVDMQERSGIKMNFIKMSVATVLALLYLVLAIPLALLILLLFVVFGLPTYSLLNRVSSKSKAYKAYEIIISPFADFFIKILDFISY